MNNESKNKQCNSEVNTVITSHIIICFYLSHNSDITNNEAKLLRMVFEWLLEITKL